MGDPGERLELSISVPFGYGVHFTRGVFSRQNGTLARVLRTAGDLRHRLLPVLDAGVAAAHPGLAERLGAYAERHPGLIEWVDAPLLVPGGEACKRDHAVVDMVLGAVARHGLCRQSFVLAVGGGAVLDAVGFAAAIAHRGLRLLRMPTTVLAQNDAGIGVKNGINLGGRKNFAGCFAPPFAVINDFDWLSTLEARDRRAGVAEAVKVALIRDPGFFAALERDLGALADFEAEASQRMIRRCAELHLAHIGSSGDPFELGSARPLDFGHWLAHHLEERSGFELRHGEAVAVGIAVDTVYSQHSLGLSESETYRILTLLSGLGFDLAPPALRGVDIERALAGFREHLGGELCITLLERIGTGREVHAIEREVMAKSIDFLLRWQGGLGPPRSEAKPSGVPTDG